MGMTGCAYLTVRDGELYASTQMAQKEGVVKKSALCKKCNFYIYKVGLMR